MHLDYVIAKDLHKCQAQCLRASWQNKRKWKAGGIKLAWAATEATDSMLSYLCSIWGLMVS